MFKSQFTILNTNYEGYIKRIYIPTEILPIIDNYDWLIDQPVNFNIAVENEENINKFANVTKRFTDREVFNIRLLEDDLPNLIMNIDDFYKSSPYGDQHVYFDLYYLANYLVDLSLASDYTLNFDDTSKPLSYFNMRVLMHSGLEFNINNEMLHDFLNDSSTLSDDIYNIFTGNDVNFDKIKDISLDFEVTEALENNLRDKYTSFEACSYDTFTPTAKLSDCIFEGDSNFNIFTYRKRGSDDYFDDYGVVAFSYNPYYNAYSAYFDSNGGSDVPTSYNNQANSKIIEPTVPTKVNYIHDGWFLDEDLTQEWDFDNSLINSDIRLYAKWIDDPNIVIPDYYTVTFETNGGSDIEPLTNVSYNTKIDDIYETIKDGYSFEGWFKDKEQTVKWDFENDRITDHTIIYASWDAEQKINPPVEKEEEPKKIIDEPIDPDNKTVTKDDVPSKVNNTPKTVYDANSVTYFSIMIIATALLTYLYKNRKFNLK